MQLDPSACRVPRDLLLQSVKFPHIFDPRLSTSPALPRPILQWTYSDAATFSRLSEKCPNYKSVTVLLRYYGYYELRSELSVNQ